MRHRIRLRKSKRSKRTLRAAGKEVSIFEDLDLAIQVVTEGGLTDEQTDFRVSWLRNYAQYVKDESLPGGVAECGVSMGEFARFINKYFPDRTLYLFDTFSGFDERGIRKEQSLNDESFLKSHFNQAGRFSGANEILVLSRMPNKENCVIKKGYFPEIAKGIVDRFCFVNLDMDLYQPMLAGLRFFYDKMCINGVILLHDYYLSELPGVKRAVDDFEKEQGRRLCKLPIGDSMSIAIIKT